MKEDPLEAVYSFVEQTYFRLQAGDLLLRCMEENSIAPIQQLVENLVLAGPQSLKALQQILVETEQRKSQIHDDLHRLVADFSKTLKSYGIFIANQQDAERLMHFDQIEFEEFTCQLGIPEQMAQDISLQVLRETRDLAESLGGHLQLLEEVEGFLQDWIWGLAFQSVRQGGELKGSGATPEPQ